jgi:hypothetical protein
MSTQQLATMVTVVCLGLLIYAVIDGRGVQLPIGGRIYSK